MATVTGRRLATVGLVVVTVADLVVVGSGWLSATYLAGIMLWFWAAGELFADEEPMDDAD